MQYFSYIVAWTNFILNTFKTLRNKTLFFNLANQFVCFNLFCILTTGCWWGFPRSKRNELLSVSPGGGFEIPLDEGCQIKTQKTWPLIIVSNVFVDFDTLQKPKFFVTIKIRCPILPPFLYSFYISLNLFSSWICICYLDVNWLIPKISACRARIWSLVASEWSEFIFCRAGWYFSESIIFRWHVYHP